MKLTALLPATLAGALALASPGGTASPPQDDARVADLIRRGRVHLDAGEHDAALELFTQADAETGGTMRSRMWVVRVWFHQARLNDAFDEVDRLARDNEGADFDYLYGMGSYLKAKTYLAQGVNTELIGFAFQDSQGFLAAALAADPERYYDAWYPLAEAAWENSKYDEASRAIEGALELRPDDPDVQFLAGRIAFQRWNEVRAREGQEQAAEQLRARAMAHYVKAIATAPAPTGTAPTETGPGDAASTDPATGPDPQVTVPDERAVFLGDVYEQIGLLLHYAEELDSAASAYAEALGWDANTLDLASYWSSLGPERFTQVAEAAAAKYAERWGAETELDATLLWWLGWAYFSAERYPECAATYEKVLAKWPAYADAHFYIAMSCYYSGDYDGAILAWHEHAKADRANLVQLLSANAELYVPVLSYVIGTAAEKGQPPGEQREYNLHAAFLCELRRDVDPSNWVHFNDLGLFAGDAGNFLRERGREGDLEFAQRLFEQARGAYESAIEMAPEKAYLYNDLGVVLDLCLERELERAMGLYEKARAMATEQLAGGGLSEEGRVDAEKAQSDAQKNIDVLRRKLEEGEGGDGGDDSGGDGGDGDGNG